jgi:hypothetical protein
MKNDFAGFRRKLLEAAIQATEREVLASQRLLDSYGEVSLPAG